MKATRVILAAVAASLLAAPVMAADTTKEPMGARMMKNWEARDTDHDGFISKAEWAAEGEKMFNKQDADHDGKISKEEWQHKRLAQREKRAEHRKEWKAAHPSAGETAPATAPATAQ